eukprot:5123868-Alexandrium_andersonii.AAC.1
MSASLVGSEMCIRDRRRPNNVAAARAAACTPAWMHAHAHECTNARTPACLLYTSDAADDM